jgi:hypothetical protein
MRASFLASTLTLVACSSLKASEPSDAGADAASENDAGSQDAQGDSGPLPVPDSAPDTACGLPANPWSATTKTDSLCADRRVYQLESWSSAGSPAEVNSLALAVAKNGRVGVAVNGITDVEQGDLRIRAFVPASATFTLPAPLVKVPSSSFENVGASVRMVAGNDDTFHLVYQRDASQSGGSVVYRKLPASNVLGAEQAVVSVGHGTELGIAVSPKTSDVLVSYYVPPTAAQAGELDTRLRPDATQVFATPLTVQRSFALDGVVGNGQHTLLFDAFGAGHVAFHLSQTFSSAVPRYSMLGAGVWSLSKTIDNNRLDAIAGYSLSLAVDDQTKYLAYYHRAQGATTAELRVAKWSLDGDTPAVDVRDKTVLADDPTTPRYAASLAVDKLGLLHLAYVRPTSATQCQIGYQRQVRAKGQVTWLEDIVVPSFVCRDRVDMAIALRVDASARPHIAYAITGDGIYYATRFDRR